MQHDGDAQHDRQVHRAFGPALTQPFECAGRELPSVGTHQDRQCLLLLARETGQITMLEQVGAMLVILVMRNVETDFVQAGGPAQPVPVMRLA